MKMPIKPLLVSLFTVLFAVLSTFAAGIPEPSLVVYGAVCNTATGNARLITGTLTWTITPASGAPVTVTPVVASRKSTAIYSRQKELRRFADTGLELAYSPTVLSA